MKQKVYIETTIPSYLAARPSRDLLVAARQQLTREWWSTHRHRFDLFISDLVLREAGAGDAEIARRRLSILSGIAALDLNTRAKELARAFLSSGLIPPNASDDAFHVACATEHGVDYVLTWNCRHIANAEISRRLAVLAGRFNCRLPTLCTPEQLMGY